jgi:soluble lytic murein transglycosylase-like protein
MKRRLWRSIASQDRPSVVRAVKIARSFGVPAYTAAVIAVAAKRVGVNPALAFALVEQESDFRHIFGHDPGGPFPGEPVTQRKYQALSEHIRNGGTSNGVGLCQITYPGFIFEHAGLWRRLANVKFGLRLVRNSILAVGSKRTALAQYNGGPTPPAVSWDYADSVLERENKWRHRFAK